MKRQQGSEKNRTGLARNGSLRCGKAEAERYGSERLEAVRPGRDRRGSEWLYRKGGKRCDREGTGRDRIGPKRDGV